MNILGSVVQGRTLLDRIKTVEWKTAIAVLIPLELRFFYLLRRLFRAQELAVLDKVSRMRFPSISGGEVHRIMPEGGLGVLIEASVIVPEFKLSEQEIEYVLNAIFPVEDWQKRMQKEVLPFLLVGLETSGQRIFDKVKVDRTFTQANPHYREAIRSKVIQFSGFVTGETRAKLNRIIKPILLQGGPTEDVRRSIQAAVSAAFESSARGTAPRARMIARTEIASAHNAASNEAMRESGVVLYKEWRTSRDLKVRLSHQLADGQIVRMGQLFRLIDPAVSRTSFLEYPGDFVHGAGPEEIINCRCVVLPSRAPVTEEPEKVLVE